MFTVLNRNYVSIYIFKYLSAKEKEAERLAMLKRQKHLEDVLRQQKKEMEAQAQSESIMDQQVDDIFGFLPVMVGGQEGQAPEGFEVRTHKAPLSGLLLCQHVVSVRFQDLGEQTSSAGGDRH